MDFHLQIYSAGFLAELGPWNRQSLDSLLRRNTADIGAGFATRGCEQTLGGAHTVNTLLLSACVLATAPQPRGPGSGDKC